jgi:hypothetical protein
LTQKNIRIPFLRPLGEFLYEYQLVPCLKHFKSVRSCWYLPIVRGLVCPGERTRKWNETYSYNLLDW